MRWAVVIALAFLALVMLRRARRNDPVVLPAYCASQAGLLVLLVAVSLEAGR